LGQKLAAHLKKSPPPQRRGLVIGLYGELGSGKTTFIQGLANGLGIKKRISSPTFVIIRDYPVPNSGFNFYHVDLYRLAEKETEGLGLEEILADHNNIVAIEWAEKAKKILPAQRIDILFKYINETTREVYSITLE
jgi:tRNA threonylcarbamoyladenosine biosynthesis protein TsaE